MTDAPRDPDDALDDALHDAHRASSNSAVLLAITIAFGAVALLEPSRIPAWLVSAWFVIVIPLNLYLMFMYRRRYRHLLEAADSSHVGDPRRGDPRR